jgi:hypothetical protein
MGIHTGAMMDTAEAEPTAATDNTGHDIAAAIAQLAKIKGEVNAHYLSLYLHLPYLQDSVRSQDPRSESDVTDFGAVYNPPESDMGITRVGLSRKTMSSFEKDGRPYILNELSLSIKPGACPSIEMLAEAIGSEVFESRMPGYDGGPSFLAEWFQIPQADGDTVQVNFTGADTCHIDVVHTTLR